MKFILLFSRLNTESNLIFLGRIEWCSSPLINQWKLFVWLKKGALTWLNIDQIVCKVVRHFFSLWYKIGHFLKFSKKMKIIDNRKWIEFQTWFTGFITSIIFFETKSCFFNVIYCCQWHRTYTIMLFLTFSCKFFKLAKLTFFFPFNALLQSAECEGL